MKIPASLLYVTLAFIVLLVPNLASAQTMSNDNYKIYMGNFNSGSGAASGGGRRLTTTIGQTSPGLYTGTNYKVRAGFQYIHSIIPFSFTISNQFVDFNSLVPGEPVSRYTTLTISNGSANGYQVTAQEKHPLRILPYGVDIPDTTCDPGTCTQTTSGAWSSFLTYGFGYRCDNISGTNCASGFSDSANFKQFANEEAGEDPVAVMTGTDVGRDKQSRITYKTNVSATQRAGLYQTVITYIATPTY